MPVAKLANGIETYYEVHGEMLDPVVMPILGITDNITDWPEGLTQPLVESGLCVICHELRDSGLSSKIDSGNTISLPAALSALEGGFLPEAAYTMSDVANDVALLMDYFDDDLGGRSVCVVGYSYGSAVAQILALGHPEKVRGLVCLQGSNYDPALPSRTRAIQKAMGAATEHYATRADKINAMMQLRLGANGSRHAMDVDEARQSATTSVDRMYYPQGTERMVLSRVLADPFFKQTENISCPTLILHGDEDPIFNIAHGEDMAARIPRAELRILAGAGHNHPLSLQPVITEHLIEFTKKLYFD